MAFPGAVPAGIGKRVLAVVVDGVAAALLGGAFVAAGAWQVLREARAAEAGGTPAVPWLLPVGGAALLVLTLAQWWFHGRRGATLGKAVVGLRTVDADRGTPVGLARVLLRGLVVAAGALAPGVGHLVVLASPLFDASGRRQGWHDRAARALVIDTTVGVDPARARATERAAQARLDGLLAPVAARDVALPAAPAVPSAPPSPQGPPPPVGGPPAPPVGGPPVSDEPVDPLGALLDVPAAAPAAPAVPSAPPAGPVGSAGAGETQVLPGVISAVPVVAPRGGPGTTPLEPTVLVDHVPVGAPRRPARGPAAPATTAGGGPTDALEGGVEDTRLRLPGGRTPRPTVDGDGTPSAVLRLWDGTSLTLTGTALVGRNPVRHDDEDLPEHLVRVPDERRSVSKTHLALGVDPQGVWVRDRGSTNGTVLTLPDGQQVLCAAGHRVRAPRGATVSFGAYWLTVD